MKEYTKPAYLLTDFGGRNEVIIVKFRCINAKKTVTDTGN